MFRLQKALQLIEIVLLAITFTIFAALFFIGKVDAAELKVTMLDVGQGDALLIQTDDENILIDTGDASARDKLFQQLETFNIERIDKLILTHPHADHIANAAFLLSTPVGEVYDNGQISSSIYYRRYVKACKEQNIPRYTLRDGDYFFLADGAYLFSSRSQDFKNINDSSLVLRLVYGDFSMLFTGDVSQTLEMELFQNYTVQSTVLKAAHHGSKTSNSIDFVKAVNPKYVFISAAANNKFGHPHKESLENFILAGVARKNIFCTAFNGYVTISTDGLTATVTPQFQNNWVDDYLGYRVKTETIWSAD
ncbi:MAG: MBL fold metallo-hydrolase [Selenomonadaceae bacterium]|nr:MBL fold metallo-hydrolase [Selenomonadaceae bacterium]